MKKEFLLFRHGQTDWNLEKRCQGHKDIPLNETGLNEATRVRGREATTHRATCEEAAIY